MIATAQRVQVVHALLDESSQAKHYSHVYSPMAPLVLDGSQDVALDQQVAQEAFAEEDEIQALELDATILDVASRTHSSQGCVRLSRAFHGSSSSALLTS